MRESFEALLAKDRYDITTRLIYADWLEEHGFDDEALEQRRRSTPRWCEADRWLHDFASRCGETCTNYDNIYCNNESEEEIWVPITYDMVIQAGYDFLNHGEWFVQLGSEKARDLLSTSQLRQEFWNNWSIVTNYSVDPEKKNKTPFSCSC